MSGSMTLADILAQREAASAAGSEGHKLHRTWEATRATHGGTRHSAERDYRAVFAVSFPIFVLVALFARLLPYAWRGRICGSETRSVLGDARAMAAATVAVAFGA
ncbi:hypothetical protein [Alsobacter sp. R-9]